ncbi:MAG: divalent cation tolerance protein CutA [Enterobacteriaceae bacterium]
MNDTTAVVVLCTAPDEATAQELASLLLAEKLAACVTLLPGATSLYCWQGKMEQEYEVQMLIKSDIQHHDALLKCIQQNHPYEVPELLVLPVLSGERKYIQWLHASLA